MDILNTIKRLKKSDKLDFYISRAKNILIREQVEDLSDVEIDRCTDGVAAVTFYKGLIKYLRDNALLPEFENDTHRIVRLPMARGRENGIKPIPDKRVEHLLEVLE